MYLFLRLLCCACCRIIYINKCSLLVDSFAFILKSYILKTCFKLKLENCSGCIALLVLLTTKRINCQPDLIKTFYHFCIDHSHDPFYRIRFYRIHCNVLTLQITLEMKTSWCQNGNSSFTTVGKITSLSEVIERNQPLNDKSFLKYSLIKRLQLSLD